MIYFDTYCSAYSWGGTGYLGGRPGWAWPYLFTREGWGRSMALGKFMGRFWIRHLYPMGRLTYFWPLGIKGGGNFNGWKVWRMGWSGFYADEVFGRILERLFRDIFLHPAIFILDRWWSEWMGVTKVRGAVEWLSKRFYLQRLDVLCVLHLLMVGWTGSVGILWLLGCIW